MAKFLKYIYNLFFKEQKYKIAYMCKTDSMYELGEALGGVLLYPSIKDLKKRRSCVRPESGSCGIVKVKVIIEEVVYEDRHHELSLKE